MLALVLAAAGARAQVVPASRTYRVELAWTATLDPSGYRVYYSVAGATFGLLQDVGLVAPDASGAVRFVPAHLFDIGPTVTFRVAAYDSSGKEGPPSNELTLDYATVASLIDSDGDGLTNAEEDRDLDQTVDADESDPYLADTDQDGLNDGEERSYGSNPRSGDSDGDGIGDAADNCIIGSNPQQTDGDADGWGDPCDNCAARYNPDQLNSDSAGGGDLCDSCALDSADLCDLGVSGSVSVDSSGGSLLTPSGNLRLDIPGGALAGPTSVSATSVPANAAVGMSGMLLVTDFTPLGRSLSQAATVTFSWSDANGDGLVDGVAGPVREADLRVWFDDAELAGPCSAPTYQAPVCSSACCDPLGNRWTLQIPRFGSLLIGSENCGNGVVGPSEDCDDGNTVGGDCCSANCRFEAPGSPCDDQDSCTLGDACYWGECVSGYARELRATKTRTVVKSGSSNDTLVVRARFAARDIASKPTSVGMTVQVLDRNLLPLFEGFVPAEGFANVRGKANQFKFKANRMPVSTANGLKKIVVKRNTEKNVGMLKAVAKETDLPAPILAYDLSLLVFFGRAENGECLEAYHLACRRDGVRGRCEGPR